MPQLKAVPWFSWGAISGRQQALALERIVLLGGAVCMEFTLRLELMAGSRGFACAQPPRRLVSAGEQSGADSPIPLSLQPM